MNSRFSLWGKKILISAGFLAISLSWAAASQAATLTYPGSAPCNSTLQACIDGANSGDTIQIITTSRIDEDIQISKTLRLESASGVTALIGQTDPTQPRTIQINDAGPGGGSVDIQLDGINFNAAKIVVNFSNDTDHRFSLTHSNLYNKQSGNSSTGALELNIQTPSTLTVQKNTFTTTWNDILVLGFLNSGSANVDISENIITASDNTQSYSGINLDLRNGGSINAGVYNNIIYTTGGCGCGASSDLIVSTINQVNATVDIVNNTIDDSITGASNGIYIPTPTGTSQLLVNILNNVITQTERGLDLPALSPQLTINNDFNHFFKNKIEDFGGYPNGPNTTLNASDIDPLYTDALNRNYLPQSGSPLIDKGTNTPPNGLPTIDITGKNRIINGTVDIGAFESGQGVADLAITQTALPDIVAVGEDVTYVLTVTNNGPEDALNVTLTDNLPGQVTFVNAFTNQGTCSGAPQLSCALGTLAKGESVQVTVVVTANAVGTVNNTATVGSDDFDPNGANNSATASTTVNAAGSGNNGSGNGGNNGGSGSGGPLTGGTAQGGGCALNPSAPRGSVLSLSVFLLPLAVLFHRRRKASL
ncbi:MAG: DUF11 domain-containing protein [bacterium]